MTSQIVDLNKPFGEVFKALDLKTQHKAMRSAMRREANRLKKTATVNLQISGIRQGTRQKLSKGIYARVYPDKYGMGFMISVKPRKRKGFHKNRQGLEKPVLMWAEEGTLLRKTKTRTKVFVRKRKGHLTGRMRKYGFIRKTEEQATHIVEKNLFNDFQKNIEKAARKQGLI